MRGPPRGEPQARGAFAPRRVPSHRAAPGPAAIDRRDRAGRWLLALHGRSIGTGGACGPPAGSGRAWPAPI